MNSYRYPNKKITQKELPWQFWAKKKFCSSEEKDKKKKHSKTRINLGSAFTRQSHFLLVEKARCVISGVAPGQVCKHNLYNASKC